MVDPNASWQSFLNNAGQAVMACAALLLTVCGIATLISAFSSRRDSKREGECNEQRLSRLPKAPQRDHRKAA